MRAQVKNPIRIMPDPFALRSTTTPSGWAFVTTTAAICDVMKTGGLFEVCVLNGRYDLDKIEEVVGKIRKSPSKCHRSYYAYGSTGLTTVPYEDYST